MRDSGGIHLLQAMPLSYLEFASLWNNGVQSGDARRFSSFAYLDDSDQPTITISTVPVPVNDFSISSEQVGLRRPERVPQSSTRTAQLSRAPHQPRNLRIGNDIPEEPRRHSSRYHDAGDQRRNNRQGYERRLERRQQSIDSGSAEVPNTSISSLSRLQFNIRSKRLAADPEVLESPVSTSTATTEVSATPSRSSEDQDTLMQEPPAIPNDTHDW